VGGHGGTTYVNAQSFTLEQCPRHQPVHHSGWWVPRLRARYAAGIRPSDDIAGWGLTFLITENDTFAQRALEEMRRTSPPEQVGSHQAALAD
jgi:hypothetical protein